MSDSPFENSNQPNLIQSGIDARSQLLRNALNLNPKERASDPSRLYAEPGPPSTIQPGSNYDKFPDTSTRKPWWPTDTNPNPQGLSKEDAPGGWGVHWADPPPVKINWPPNQPSGPVGDPPVLKPDPIQPPRLDDGDARNSVNINTDARSVYLTAGLTGAAVSTATHFGDVYTGAIEPSQRAGAVAYWRDNFSPSQRVVPQRREALQAVESQLPELRTEANAAGRVFDRQVRYRTQLADTYVSQIPSTPVPQSDFDWYSARVDLVRSDSQFNARNVMANSGTQAQVDLRQRLFTTDEGTRVASQSDAFWRDATLSRSANNNLVETEVARNRAAQVLTRAERGSITTGTDALFNGLGRGLLVGTAAVAADYALDRTLGNSPELSNQAHWGLQGIGMPLLLLSELSPVTKVVGSMAMIGASHLLDQSIGPPTGAFSGFARPSLPEVGLATAGALAPVGDWRMRAGLAVSGWIIGKAWNLVDDKLEITGASEPRLRAATQAAVEQDIKSPSLAHFDFTVDEMRKFSDKNDAAAAVTISDWQNSNVPQTAIDKERGSAALMFGYGESALDRGSRIDLDKWDKDGAHVLAGANYDLGAQASTYLRAASGNLEQALEQAKANKGSRVSSGTIDDAYISQLDLEKSHVDQLLEKVYGLHDIAAVYAGVKQAVVEHEEDMRHFGRNIEQFYETMNDSQPRYKAKIARDLAIVRMAFGELDQTEGGKSQNYKDALAYAQEAARLDPKAADQAQIQSLLSNPH